MRVDEMRNWNVATAAGEQINLFIWLLALSFLRRKESCERIPACEIQGLFFGVDLVLMNMRATMVTAFDVVSLISLVRALKDNPDCAHISL